MGLFSRKRGRHRSGSRSLVHTNEESPELQEVEEAAAADVARVREDEKYFDREEAAKQDEG
jgi:hypothetical protein